MSLSPLLTCPDDWRRKAIGVMKKMVLCGKSSSENGARGRANANGDLVDQNEHERHEPDAFQHLSSPGMPTRPKSRSSLLKTLRCHWRKCKAKSPNSRWAECSRDPSDGSGPALLPSPTGVCCAAALPPDDSSLEIKEPPAIEPRSDANDNYVRGQASDAHEATDGNCQGAQRPTSSLVPVCAVPPRVLPDLRMSSLTQELFKLSKHGWYWGPITRCEAEEKLADQPDGAFLVRDSSDDRYLLSLTFKSYGKTLHTRIEHCNGLFSFYAQSEPEGRASIVDLIQESMNYSQSGVFCYSRGRSPGVPSFPVRLIRPVSRLTHVRSLQYLCRFVIRQYTRFDHIQSLPLPSRIKGYLEEGHY